MTSKVRTGVPISTSAGVRFGETVSAIALIPPQLLPMLTPVMFSCSQASSLVRAGSFSMKM